jgi:hypothetical protein
MENQFIAIRELGSKGKRSNPLVLEEFLWKMNGLKSLMKVKGIIFSLPWMKQSVQHKPSEAKIFLGVLLQLSLRSLTGPMLGLGNMQEILT